MSEQTHGPAVTVAPSTPAKQYRKAAASAMISAGMFVTALQSALPYLQHEKWFPLWAAPLVAAVGAGWAAWKQAMDAQNIAPVNLSQPTVKHDYGEVSSLPATMPIADATRPSVGSVTVPPTLAHGDLIAGQVAEFDEAQNRTEGE